MRPDGNGRPPLEQDEVVRVPVELLAESGVTAGAIRVYAAIRRRVGFEPTAENFLTCYPSVPKIAEDAGLHEKTVVEAIRWLANRDYLLRDRRPNRSSVYTLIVRRVWFRENAEREGRAHATARYRVWMTEMADESRRGQARVAGDRNPRQERDSGRKSPGDYRPERREPGDSLGGSAETPSGVAGRLPRTGFKGNCGSENRGAPTGAPLALIPSREPDRALARKFVAEIREKAGKP